MNLFTPQHLTNIDLHLLLLLWSSFCEFTTTFALDCFDYFQLSNKILYPFHQENKTKQVLMGQPKFVPCLIIYIILNSTDTKYKPHTMIILVNFLILILMVCFQLEFERVLISIQIDLKILLTKKKTILLYFILKFINFNQNCSSFERIQFR